MPQSDEDKDGEGTKDSTEDTMQKSLDGGWGYVVVFSSFMIHFVIYGVINTFGIFYKEFLDHFQEGRGTTSWVASALLSTPLLFSPIASGLTNRYGCRKITVAGSLLATFGFVTSTLVPSVTYLFFTAGVCAGVGFGLMYIPAVVCLPYYFDKKLAFANGVAGAGTGIGTFALAPFIQWVLDLMGWKNAMLIVAGIILNCCVFGALFRPMVKTQLTQELKTLVPKLTDSGRVWTDPSKYTSPSMSNGIEGHNNSQTPLLEQNEPFHMKSESNNKDSSEFQNQQIITKPISFTASTYKHLSSQRFMSKDNSTSDSSKFMTDSYKSSPNLSRPRDTDSCKVCHRQNRFLCRFLCGKANTNCSPQKIIDFSLMKNVVVLIICISCFLMSVGYNVPFVYTKDRVVALHIASEEQASYLLSIIGITNTASRVIFGYISDCNFVNRLYLYNISLALCGVATALSSLCTDFTSMAIYASVFGMTAGTCISLTSIVLIDLLGLDKLSNAYGIAMTFRGTGALCGPPITGWIYDYTGSYTVGFSFSGAMIALSGIILFFIPYFQDVQHPCTFNAPKEERREDTGAE